MNGSYNPLLMRPPVHKFKLEVISSCSDLLLLAIVATIKDLLID